jgi:excisionase family DNA binding protein
VNVLTASEVAQMLGCSVASVYRLKDAGELPAAFKIFEGQKGWRWQREEVLRYLERKRLPRLTPVREETTAFIPIGRREP